ncbi:MAG: hypothetical protein JO261_14715 [Alphaproteobacteria bacterium]|nr:hypothetical protein [Alphaproteobacteria bacterium]MBV9694947.1 hypothetical protein [Alphaproteobacteria bacterium]
MKPAGIEIQIHEAESLPVRDRAAEMGCGVPSFAIMPNNFFEARTSREFAVHSQSVILRDVFAAVDLSLGSFAHGVEHVEYCHESGFDWRASLFLSSDLSKWEPDAAAIAILLIRQHLRALFGADAGKRLQLSLVIERPHDLMCRKLVYEGGVDGLGMLPERIARIVAA